MHLCSRLSHHLGQTGLRAAARGVPPLFAAAVSARPSPSLLSRSVPLPPHPRGFVSQGPTRPHRQLQQTTEAVEIIDPFPALETHLMLTCEHASMRLPTGWQWPETDNRLLGTHWSFDPGAEEFTRELVSRIPSVAILSRFSRLLCDPNRPLGADTMFRAESEGKEVELNSKGKLTKTEVDRRVELLYTPYHTALKLVADEIKPRMVLSIHSFSPVYEGQTREVEVGVLYKEEKDKALAEQFLKAFESIGCVARLNEPWSAKEGFMYAADQYSSPLTNVVMFEFRQDLLVKEEWRHKVLQQTEAVIRQNGHA